MKVTYLLSYGIILVSFFYPYYIIDGNNYYRFSPRSIFSWFYIIIFVISLGSNWLIMYKVKAETTSLSDFYAIAFFNLVLLSERIWQPLINPVISTTPNLTIGLFLYHAGLFIQWIGVYFYKIHKDNEKLMRLP